jgi:LmbE family N-acetylglucosaminyl deacetylase
VPSVLAIAAHPDDIEFVMAGTMLRLGAVGWDLHYINLSTGNMGSTVMSARDTAQARFMEARAAAKLLGAIWYPPFCDDLSIFYTEENLRRLCAVIRQAQPTVVLTHALADYMEDHMITARLAVTATFARGIPNYQSQPEHAPVLEACTVYHAMPHGQCTPLRERVTPELYVDTSTVHGIKRAALACHASQKEWLDKTQGQESYITTMEDFSVALGRESGAFSHAEGWTRHLHYGFGAEKDDPLREVLGGGVRKTR